MRVCRVSPAWVALYVTVVAVLVYAVALIGWWHRIDDVDRFAVRCSRYNTELRTCDYASPALIAKMLWVGLIVPFRSGEYFARVTRGGMYSGYEPIRGNAALRHGMQDKVFWWRTFRRWGIPTPKVLAYTRNGRLVVRETLSPTDEYVQKPRRGGLGMHVQLVPGADVLGRLAGRVTTAGVHSRPPRYDYVVQQRLRDCTMAGRARHFRVVTVYNMAAPFVTRNMIGERGSLVSNGAHNRNGSSRLCRRHACPGVAARDQRAVNALSRRLVELHRAEFASFFSIGWDIMLDCDGERRVAYCLEGNIGHGTWPHDVDVRVIRAYKRRYRAFLCEHGLLRARGRR